MNYRILKHGETILPGDEWLDSRDNEWKVRDTTFLPEKLNLYDEGGHHAIHRRKVEYPEHTPPAPPEGMRWEYRGRSWFNQRKITTFYGVTEKGEVDSTPSTCDPAGFHHIHYFEAVPDLPNLVITEGAHGWKFGKSINPLDPKGAAGALKPQLQLIPTVAMQEEAKALDDGRAKYGQDNWRSNKVCISTYIGAILRHTLAYRDGEDVDPESKSGVHHLGSVRACCAILLDAAKHGTLVDDRPSTNPDTTI